MSLQLYTGTAGSGKTTALMKRILEIAKSDPRERVFLIVPEQFTMQAQRELVRLSDGGAILNAEVISLTRLAERVFEETGVKRETMLEEIGKSFLIMKSILECRDKLPCVGGFLGRPEYVYEMKSLVSEWLQYGVTPEALKEACGERKEEYFGCKCGELVTVYENFLGKLKGTYMTSEQVPEKLASVIGKMPGIDRMTFAFDGFTGFTPLQLLLIGKMMPVCRDMLFTVTCDRDIKKSGELFAMGREMKEALYGLAEQGGVGILPERVFTEGKRWEKSPALGFLERQLFRNGIRKYEGRTDDIRILAASSPREEAFAVAAGIRELVRKEGLRYRDITVMAGDLEMYGPFFEEALEVSGIPYFIDRTRTLDTLPLIRCIRAALDVADGGFAFDDVIRFVKSGFPVIPEANAFALEKTATERGLRGRKKWEKSFAEAKNEKTDEDARLRGLAEEGRAVVTEKLRPLADALSVRGGSVRQKTEGVRRFLDAISAHDIIDAQTEECRRTGDLEKEKLLGQILPYVEGLLDKLEGVLGDAPMSRSDFVALFESGFDEGRIASIPPYSDLVVVTDMERSRTGRVDTLFFAGVNEGSVPPEPVSGGLLTDAERSYLKEKNIDLKPTLRKKVSIDRFYLYQALTRPSRRLVLSFSMADREGNARRPSSLIGNVRRMIPALRTEFMSEKTEDRVTGTSADAGLLSAALTDEKKRDDPAFLTLWDLYRRDPEKSAVCDNIIKAALSRAVTDPIGREAAKKVYGDMFFGAPSRMENYYRCEYRYFCQYGLDLCEWKSPEFSYADMGNVCHGALEKLDKRLRDNGMKLSDIDTGSDETMKMLEELLEESAREEENGAALDEDPRSRYQMVRMKRLLNNTLKALRELEAAGEFVPEAEELPFKLPVGDNVILKGRIDKVEVCRKGDTAYVRVIDYKTGQKEFKFGELYAGLQMQLAVYMKAALDAQMKKGVRPMPAAMMYYLVKDPVLEYIDGETAEKTEARRIKKMQGSGVFNSSEEVLPLLDKSLSAPGNASAVLPLKRNKDGKPHASGNTASTEGFGQIEDHVLSLVRRASERTSEGCVTRNPVRFSNKDTVCGYCPYHAVCGFDRKKGYSYRDVYGMSGKEFFEAVGKEENGHGMDK